MYHVLQWVCCNGLLPGKRFSSRTAQVRFTHCSQQASNTRQTTTSHLLLYLLTSVVASQVHSPRYISNQVLVAWRQAVASQGGPPLPTASPPWPGQAPHPPRPQAYKKQPPLSASANCIQPTQSTAQSTTTKH